MSRGRFGQDRRIGDQQARDQREDGQDRDDGDHGPRPFMGRSFGFSQKDLAENAQEVKHGQNSGEQGHGGDADSARLDRPHDHQEFRKEAAEGRDADDREGAEEEGEGRQGHRFEQPAHLADVPLVGGVDDDPGAEEQFYGTLDVWAPL